MKEKAYNLNRPVNFYVPFIKYEETGDDFRVYGYATTPHLDYDGQKIDMASFIKALPEYLIYGNVREMHQLRPVGKVLNDTVIAEEEKGVFLGLRVIPESTKALVRGEVLTGISVGLADCEIRKSDDAPNGIICGDKMKIIEISLVDRPANPHARITAYKLLEGDKVETILQKIESVIPPSETPLSAKAAPDKAAEPQAVKLVTFAAAVAAQEMAQELPTAMNTLWDVLQSIIYDPEASVADKTAAMQQSCSEFSDHILAAISGEKLAKEIEARKAAPKPTDFYPLNEKIKTKPDEPIILSRAIGPDVTDLTKQFQEAISTIGKLQERLDKADTVNKELTERVAIIEKQPLPPKAIANTDVVTGGAGLPENQKQFDELARQIKILSISGDPEVRKAADKIGQGIFKQAFIGGN